MSSDIAALKTELRTAMRARRDAMTPDEVQQHSALIQQTVCGLSIFAAADTICCYMAFGNEARTEGIIREALARGKEVVMPRVAAKEHRLALHAVADLSKLRKGPFGILEPSARLAEVAPERVGLFLVPGIAFDATGNRLGFGAGYYDDLLQYSNGWRVAMAYSAQMAPRVPAMEHDVSMDMIVTEAGIIDCGRGQQASDRLRLKNMIFHGHHGAFPEERAQGIRLAIDVDLRLDLQTPGLTDDLRATVDYPAIYQLIQRIQSGREFTLFEALAEQVAQAILREFPQVEEVTVRARKFHPPVGGLMDAFEVEITRSRMGAYFRSNV